MCSFSFFQHNHSLRRNVSISTINSPEQTCACLRWSCMCVFVWGHINLHRSNPTPTLLREATDHQRKTRSIHRAIVNETLPGTKKVERENDRKREGKKQLQSRNHSQAWVLWENTSEKSDSTRNRLTGEDNTHRQGIFETLRAVDART